MTGRIVTSCFFAKNLPKDIVRVSVARSEPRGQAGFHVYRSLAPGKWFSSVDPDTYRKLYFDEILGRLNPVQVVKELSFGRDWSAPSPCSAWYLARLQVQLVFCSGCHGGP